jgi:hypothetical protein
LLVCITPLVSTSPSSSRDNGNAEGVISQHFCMYVFHIKQKYYSPFPPNRSHSECSVISALLT